MSGWIGRLSHGGQGGDMADGEGLAEQSDEGAPHLPRGVVVVLTRFQSIRPADAVPKNRGVVGVAMPHEDAVDAGRVELIHEVLGGAEAADGLSLAAEVTVLCRGGHADDVLFMLVGDLVALLTVMKGLPLAYNKDMQEDKEAIFDAVDTVKLCLPVFTDMIDTMTVKKENMEKLNYIIGKNLQILRKKNRFTQAQLGEKLNYSDKAVSKWERGESVPDITVLKAIADMFEVPLDYLVRENPELPPIQEEPELSSGK